MQIYTEWNLQQQIVKSLSSEKINIKSLFYNIHKHNKDIHKHDKHLYNEWNVCTFIYDIHTHAFNNRTNETENSKASGKAKT